ncbi:MAG: four helix bundle protein [Verrucomicrobia bacterium]|nr:four helix bundle protein [Verrucomicrobiota bacterium]MBU1908728.1 four helix bundle protein [Verrucomicrobiota bacterium]
MIIRRFEDIEAWQIARELAKQVYVVSAQGSFRRDYSLKDQINRAAGSAMDNTAEGFDGGSSSEFIRFLGYAQRSCLEVQSQLYRALDRGHIDQKAFSDLYDLTNQARSKIGGFIKYLKSCRRQPRTKNQEPDNSP